MQKLPLISLPLVSDEAAATNQCWVGGGARQKEKE
jgi:hypothetical protein